MHDLISVVVPTYNRAGLIRDALDSVAAQSHRPIELIIADDGSTDGTEEAVGSWSDAHRSDDFTIRYDWKENAGGNAARNRGIELARGAFVAFLDSDDAWQPDKLVRQLRHFDDPEVGAVYCGVQHMDFATKTVLEPTERPYPSGWILPDMLVRDVTAQTSAYVVRREVFAQVGRFDETLQARQDWDMWIRIAAEFKIAAEPSVLVDFREHAGVRTASNPRKEIDAYRSIRGKYARLRRKASLGCRLKAFSSYAKRMARVHHKHRLSYGKALGYGLGAVVSWPFDFDNFAALAGLFLPAGLRGSLHRRWNGLFGRTRWAIRSH